MLHETAQCCHGKCGLSERGRGGMIGAVCDLSYTYRCAYVNLHVHAHTSTALGQIYPHSTIECFL